jgi:hypothetical protein
MPHSGAPPAVNNQPPVNTQGGFDVHGQFIPGTSSPVSQTPVSTQDFSQGPSQPFQLGQRDVGQGPLLGTILQQLLGREGRPSLPQNQQVSNQELRAASNQAAQGGDVERTRILRQLLEQRQPEAVSVGPKGPDVSSPGVGTSAEEETKNPLDLFRRKEFQGIIDRNLL